jgi:hypothetical protein
MIRYMQEFFRIRDVWTEEQDIGFFTKTINEILPKCRTSKRVLLGETIQREFFLISGTFLDCVPVFLFRAA